MVTQAKWQHRIEEIIRSRHYTWIGEGLGGDELPEAVIRILSDSMHIARREGLDWSTLYQAARQRFEQEELEAMPQ